eukprot:CAMPEP_0179879384 /NCGR_PEP_ID=MMETSP0982-20121206/26193_1 /TAXON_ID=483367 /ORGANISM="non described non described, Strain CCMP 2436" /LENGTH=51 /DNA_ID=CAMNT_0021772843 /DNA_START=112 /DNA_END=267 /DNA_ORIENTATION=-
MSMSLIISYWRTVQFAADDERVGVVARAAETLVRLAAAQRHAPARQRLGVV